MRRLAAMALILLALAAGRVAAEPSFGEANQLYSAGEFEAAAAAYEQLIERGVENEALYYNLGNSYFRIAELGRAIYNYERALRLEPGFEDAHYNLTVAREVVAERFGARLEGAEHDPLWIRVTTFFPMSQLTLALIGLNLLFFAILIGLRFLAEGFARTALVVTNAFVGVALAVALVLVLAQAYYLERLELGIVIEDQVVMREGADEQHAERGLLHPGLRVQIRGERDNWLRVRLSNGVDGWVPRDSVGRL